VVHTICECSLAAFYGWGVVDFAPASDAHDDLRGRLAGDAPCLAQRVVITTRLTVHWPGACRARPVHFERWHRSAGGRWVPPSEQSECALWERSRLPSVRSRGAVSCWSRQMILDSSRSGPGPSQRTRPGPNYSDEGPPSPAWPAMAETAAPGPGDQRPYATGRLGATRRPDCGARRARPMANGEPGSGVLRGGGPRTASSPWRRFRN
jgi:hypothetical protein